MTDSKEQAELHHFVLMEEESDNVEKLGEGVPSVTSPVVKTSPESLKVS